MTRGHRFITDDEARLSLAMGVDNMDCPETSENIGQTNKGKGAGETSAPKICLHVRTVPFRLA